MKYTYKKIVNVCIKPSDIYRSKEFISKVLAKEHAKITKFLPPKFGEKFISADESDTVITCYSASAYGEDEPRFIVEDIIPDISAWE